LFYLLYSDILVRPDVKGRFLFDSPAGVSALSLAGAGALAFGGVKILKKKKQDV